jgi:hypothetical protein
MMAVPIRTLATTQCRFARSGAKNDAAKLHIRTVRHAARHEWSIRCERNAGLALELIVLRPVASA